MNDLLQSELGLKVPTKTTRKSAKATGTISTKTTPYDDGFSQFYHSESNVGGLVIQPPINYSILETVVAQNNTLGQCIAAYEVNIDGTGHAITLDDTKPVNKNLHEAIKSFFATPYPGLSMISIRRHLRRELERTGCAYLEVLRDGTGAVAFLNPVESKTMRLVRLDDAVPVSMSIIRNGVPVSVTMNIRERRFAQVVGTKIVYFKEWGASRDLNTLTGEWADKGTLSLELQATEIMYFMVNKDDLTPYGIPRWINQTPSVLGSRKAEEANLSYLDAGGIPPAIVFVSGGEFAKGAKTQINNLLHGKGSNKNRVAVAELSATGGSIDNAGKVDVKVERFGSERISDSMFENYDDKCEQRTRASFRLPPIFVGRTQDYTLATANTSYAVAEAQVFQPERLSFDERMNLFIMREFNTDAYYFRSLPLSVKDPVIQMDALKLVTSTGSVNHGVLVDNVNEVAGTTIQVSADLAEQDIKPPQPAPSNPNPPVTAPVVPAPVTKTDINYAPEKLAYLWARVIKGSSELSEARVAQLKQKIDELDGIDLDVYQQVITNAMYNGEASSNNMAELCACAGSH